MTSRLHKNHQTIVRETERLMVESLKLLEKIHDGLAQNQARIERARNALRQSILMLDGADRPAAQAGLSWTAISETPGS